MVWYIGIIDIFDLIPKGRELIDPEILVNFCVYVYSFNFWPINFNLHALEIFIFSLTGNSCQVLFLGAPKSLQMVIVAMKLKDAYSLEAKLWPT